MTKMKDTHGNEIELSAAQTLEYHEWLCALIGRQGRKRLSRRCSAPENLARSVVVAALKKELEISRARLVDRL